MTQIKKVYYVTIPYYVNVWYFKSKNVLILNFNNKTCMINTDGFYLVFLRNKLITFKLKLFDISLNFKIKLYLLEVEVKTSLKTKLFGLGYKIFLVASLNHKVLLFKLGLSHFIYYKIPNNTQIFLVKSLQLYINSYFFYETMFNLAIIKSLKKPDCYKGKGFVSTNDNLKLKPGKKL